MDEANSWLLVFYAILYGVGIPVGLTFAILKGRKFKDLNAPDKRPQLSDGITFRTESRQPTPEVPSETVWVASRTAPPTEQHGSSKPQLHIAVETFARAASLSLGPGACWRMQVPGLDSAKRIAFRITKKSGGKKPALAIETGNMKLDARIVVDSTRPDPTKRVLQQIAVHEALLELLGAPLAFRAIDLFPDGDLAIDFKPSRALQDEQHKDVVVRVMNFARALEEALPALDDMQLPQLSAASSASGSSATFSIEVRR